jgi:hypothetical protein
LVPITTLGKTAFVADGSLGIQYKVTDKYYVGLSCINFLQTQLKQLEYGNKRTYDLTGGYNWVLPGLPAYELQPSAFITDDLGAYSFSIVLFYYTIKNSGEDLNIAYRMQLLSWWVSTLKPSKLACRMMLRYQS